MTATYYVYVTNEGAADGTLWEPPLRFPKPFVARSSRARGTTSRQRLCPPSSFLLSILSTSYSGRARRGDNVRAAERRPIRRTPAEPGDHPPRSGRLAQHASDRRRPKAAAPSSMGFLSLPDAGLKTKLVLKGEHSRGRTENGPGHRKLPGQDEHLG